MLVAPTRPHEAIAAAGWQKPDTRAGPMSESRMSAATAGERRAAVGSGDRRSGIVVQGVVMRLWASLNVDQRAALGIPSMMWASGW